MPGVFRVDKNWVENLDEKHNLLGFENGVFDLDTNEFRDGRPDDMITLSTRYDYSPIIVAEIRKKIMIFFESIMPNEAMTEFLLKMLAYELHGSKYLQKISFWTGTGANGKSFLQFLIISTLGQYCYTPSVTLVTTKKTSSSTANEDLAKSKGVRACYMSEPNQDDKFQLGTMKSLSGGDKAQAREMYKAFLEFYTQFHMTILMNIKPSLNGYDTGFVRRLSIIPFPFKFNSNPKNAMEKLGDDTLEQYLKNDVIVRQQFMLVLLEYYNSHIRGNKPVAIPDEVNEATNDYLQDNNIIGNFIRDYLDVTGLPSDKIIAKELFDMFRQSTGESRMAYNTFKEQMGINGFKTYQSKARDSFRDKFVFDKLKMKESINDLQDE